jgi:hypothetical protein
VNKKTRSKPGPKPKKKSKVKAKKGSKRKRMKPEPDKDGIIKFKDHWMLPGPPKWSRTEKKMVPAYYTYMPIDLMKRNKSNE